MNIILMSYLMLMEVDFLQRVVSYRFMRWMEKMKVIKRYSLTEKVWLYAVMSEDELRDRVSYSFSFLWPEYEQEESFDLWAGIQTGEQSLGLGLKKNPRVSISEFVTPPEEHPFLYYREGGVETKVSDIEGQGQWMGGGDMD